MNSFPLHDECDLKEHNEFETATKFETANTQTAGGDKDHE
jgi:hypothetical protein